MNSINNSVLSIYTKDAIAIASTKRFASEVKREEERTVYYKNIADIQEQLRGKLNFMEGLILYDLVYRQYHSMKRDILLGRISKKDVQKVIKKANDIKKVFNEKDILNQLATK